jgi:hypothetical protein
MLAIAEFGLTLNFTQQTLFFSLHLTFIILKIKVNFTLEHTIKFQKGSMSLHFL